VYRVNLEGRFNVPYSHETARPIFDGKLLLEGSKRLEAAQIHAGDFEHTVNGAKCGDFVYFDPPYTVLHDNNGFIEYNEKIFSWSDQQRLKRVAEKLAQKGVEVLISNAAHGSILELYEGHEIIEIARASTISARRRYRTNVKEVLIKIKSKQC
jgi:DNA adenine methylase